MNEQNNSPEQGEGVRLVGRREAEAAIQSGHAVTKTSPATGTPAVHNEPIVIGEPHAVDLRPVDLRAVERQDVVHIDESIPEEQMSLPDDEDETPETEPSANLPHWTEPPTGEVPAVLSNLDEELPEDSSATTASSTWSFTSLGEASGLGESNIDFDSFDDDPFDVISPSPFRTATPPPTAEAGEEQATSTQAQSDSSEDGTNRRPNVADVTMEKVGLLKKSSLTQRLGTGVVFAIVAAVCFSAGPTFVLALCSVTVLIAAMEYFDAVRRVGYRPPTALGLMSVAGAMLGVYARGEAAIPLVLALVTVFTFLWYLVGVIEESPTANTAVTLLGIVWTGIFGSFAALLLREPNRHGVAFILGGALCVIAYDTAAYIGGTLLGRHVLAPRVSPGKTWEGLACASVASVLVGGLVVQAIHPWSVGGGFLLGLVVAIVAPIGDLAESMVKRDLGLKDMGRILPGHGGVFDRFDALLLVLPATYYLVRMLNLA